MSSRHYEVSVRLLLIGCILLVVHRAGAQTSPHGALKWSCESCHSTDSWKMRTDASFDHAETGLALEGQHKGLQCVTCHKELKFVGMTSSCTRCHVDIHKSELGDNCTRCHTQQTWKITDMIQRHQWTRFPLLGRHSTLGCQDCHASTMLHQYLGTPVTCYGCHRVDYQKTSSPNHATVGFSTECALCHQGNAFSWGTGFDHSLTTFPLTGAHRAAACKECHGSTQFSGLSTNCVDCHGTAFSNAANPNHATAGFSHQCQMCHSTTSWQPATFDHSTTKFSLTGAHSSLTCQTCHTSGNYQLAYINCYQCHASDYNGTTNPVHSTAGFPTTCETCHTTKVWTGATFNHTWFPQNHGNSGGACAKCHTNSANYTVFSCTTAPCHPQSQTDSNHRGRSGYVYNSANCYSCHPRG